MVDETLDDQAQLVEDVERGRFELVVDGQVVAFLSFHSTAGVISLDHAEVRRSERGRGVGARLVAAVLDELRSRGISVRPVCSFVVGFVQDHPEYSSMVAA